MNEKSLLKSWKSFAQQHGLKLTVDEQPNIRGVVTEYLLQINAFTLLKARIGKTGSYHQESCKLIISKKNHELKEQTIKVKKFFSFRDSALKKEVRDFLEEYGIKQMDIKQNSFILTFNQTPVSLKEHTIYSTTIPEELNRLVKRFKETH